MTHLSIQRQSGRERTYSFPGRNGWSFADIHAPVHSSGARVFSEQIAGDDEWHYVVQWWAETVGGARLGPFRRFAEALSAAVPRGQLWLPGVAA